MKNSDVSENMNDFSDFYRSSHFWGRTTLIAVILASVSAPLYMFLVVGAFPGWNALGAGLVGYAGFMGVMWILEPITYYPILGTAGTYIAFLSGNIANLCLPCAAAAQESISAEPGSKKAEISGVFGIAMASLVNTIVIIITIIGGTLLFELIPAGVIDAFDFVLPAIFGAVLGQFAVKTPLYGVLALVIGFVVLYSPIFSVIKVAVTVALTIAIIMFIENEKIKKAENE